MSDLGDLYQELILDHNRKPRNLGHLARPDRHALGHNPLCGDKLSLDVQIEDDVISDIRFQGEGCAISTASASLMTEAVKGKTRAEAEAIFDDFHDLVTGTTTVDPAALGKLAAFAGVGRFPARVKCATLAWQTLRAALHGNESVTTE